MPEDDPNLQAVLAGLNVAALDALRGAGLAGVPHLPASNEGLEAEFFGRAYSYSRRWLLERGGKVDEEKPCGIILSRAILQDIERLDAEIIPYFNASPDTDIAGKVLITNDDLSVVAMLPNCACGGLSEVAKALQAAQLHEAVHVIFRPNRGELILCREGVLGANSQIRIELGPARQLSQLELEREIWAFHRQFTQTPSGYLLPWKGPAANRITIEELERRISGMLAFYLRGVVGFEHVNMEHYSPHGRVDVSVSSAAMLPGLGPCALELKVLRSRRSSGANAWTTISPAEMLKHAKAGIGQAVEYRQDLHADIAYLCCFDARLQDEDQLEVIALGAEKGVEVRRYFMYESTGAHRDAKAAADAAGLLLAGEVN